MWMQMESLIYTESRELAIGNLTEPAWTLDITQEISRGLPGKGLENKALGNHRASCMAEVARNQDTGKAAVGHGDCERETEQTSPRPYKMGGVLQRTYGDSSLCSPGTDWVYGGQFRSRRVGEGAAALAQRSQFLLNVCYVAGRVCDWRCRWWGIWFSIPRWKSFT